LTCATVLATSLTASVALQRQTHVPARSAQDAIDARLDASLLRAIDQAYLDQDLELADSFQRLRETRVRAH
jgi:hypothetical protein